MTNNPGIAAMMASAATLCTVLAVWVLRRGHGVRGAGAFGAMMVAAVVWSASAAFEAGLGDIAAKMWAARVGYIGTLSVPVLWFVFASVYSGRDRWVTRRSLVLLALIPILSFVLVATTEYHGLVWTGTTLDSSTGTILYRHGVVFWVLAVLGYVFMLVGVVYVLDMAAGSRTVYRLQAGVIAAAVIITWIANLAYLLGFSPWAGVDLAPLAFTFTGCLVAWALIGLGLFRLVPVANETLLSNVSDAVLVLDVNGALADANPFAVRWLGLNIRKAVGRPAREVLAAWPPVVDLVERLQEGKHDGRLQGADPKAEPRDMEIALSRVVSPRGQRMGWLLVLHDVTERTRAQEALLTTQTQLMDDIAERRRLEAENSRLLEEAHRRAEEAETLRMAGAAVVASLNLDEAIDRILEELARVVPYESALVQLLRDGGFEVVGQRGFDSERDLVGRILPLARFGPARCVYEKRRAVWLADWHKMGSRLVPGREHTHSWLGVPLMVHDRLVGMMVLDDRDVGRFTADHARLAEAFADQVAVALENARLFAEAQALAVTDPLTGLRNRRHFYEEGGREFARARRYPPKPLGCLMLDIDRFKLVNDRYGHLVGDAVLRGLARVCRRELRMVDLFVRFGGEEFVVLVPETDSVGARAVAERLRLAVAYARFDRLLDGPDLPEGPPLPRVTVSVGVAALTAECSNLDQLVGLSDRALYLAKQQGRNRVCVWEEPEEADGVGARAAPGGAGEAAGTDL
ncbi:MAG: diguanylate cyclase [Gaiellales bacterium]|nr:diguanylate cyclase [Gaiellales bacterium]